ncbi:MAG: hypothetical protein DRJ18_01310 [Candidatus Methanomethylicota archaeon]|nr:MAG: hypothetical protein DRJ18_01310 [Candidatus Verstraetearchaeota archaeon]
MEALVALRAIVDEREKGCKVPWHLRTLGVRVLFKRLAVGDYILSSDCAVERKTARDFVNSVSSGRIFDQAYRLAESYSKPTLIIEGDVRIAISTLKAGIRSFFGALAFLWMAYDVATFFTSSELETAELLYALIKHEQAEIRKRIVIRGKPKLETLREKQLFVVQSFPGIGPKLAERLLRRFGSIKRIVNAAPIELALVEGLGRKRGVELARFFEARYDEGRSSFKQARLDELDV